MREMDKKKEKLLKEFNVNGKTAHLIVITVLYLVSHALLLLNNGIYWDDWTLYGVPARDILDAFNQAGFPVSGYFHNYLLSHNNFAIYYRGIVFVSYYFSAIFLYFVLCSIDKIPDDIRCFTILLFAILPLNVARMAMINTFYALYYLSFFFGFYLCSQHLKKNSIILRVLSLCLLFLSFNTNSILFYYLIVLAYILYYRMREADLSLSAVKNIILKHLDFFMLPIVYWITKKLYFVPSKLYAGYNEISLSNVLLFPAKAVITFQKLISGFTYNSYQVVDSVYLFFLLSFLILAISLTLPNIETNSSDKLKLYAILVLGLIATLVAIFPYVAVGKIPASDDWDSRHQLLMPFGVALTIISSAYLILVDKVKIRIALSSFVALCVVININTYLNFEKDWIKQVGIIENMKMSRVISGNTSFLFEDNTLDLNANKRKYRFYEFTGLMKSAFGSQTRFADNYTAPQDLDSYGGLKPFLNNIYSLADYKPKLTEYIIFVCKGDIQLRIPFIARMIYYKNFDHNNYLANAKNVIRLSEVKLLR